MNYTHLITEDQRSVLKKARQTYGYQKQLSVCSEELAEMSIVCNKHFRYGTPEKALDALHDEALTEVADTLIVLDHIVNIFGVREAELASRIAGKIDRLSRWMSETDSLEQSTVDRAVVDSRRVDSKTPCEGCNHYGLFKNLAPGGICATCREGSNYKSGEDL